MAKNTGHHLICKVGTQHGNNAIPEVYIYRDYIKGLGHGSVPPELGIVRQRKMDRGVAHGTMSGGFWFFARLAPFERNLGEPPKVPGCTAKHQHFSIITNPKTLDLPQSTTPTAVPQTPIP